MKKEPDAHDIPPPGLVRRWTLLCLVFLGSAAAVWAALHFLRQEPGTVVGPGLRAAHPQAGAHGLAKLVGEWVRSDGGYTLRVQRVDPRGSADVQYRNPAPVRVASAKASLESGAPTLFVELRDADYPGCTYTLTYDPSGDHLTGVYFQAGTGQRYPVVFQRRRG